MPAQTEKRIKVASEIMGRAVAKLATKDPELARRLSKALANEVEHFRFDLPTEASR